MQPNNSTTQTLKRKKKLLHSCRAIRGSNTVFSCPSPLKVRHKDRRADVHRPVPEHQHNSPQQECLRARGECTRLLPARHGREGVAHLWPRPGTRASGNGGSLVPVCTLNPPLKPKVIVIRGQSYLRTWYIPEFPSQTKKSHEPEIYCRKHKDFPQER